MTVGILGAGQLGRMIALAGHPLGIFCTFLDPAADACAGAVGRLVARDYRDPEGQRLLAENASVVTFEFENVPVDVVRALGQRVAVYPGPRSLECGQDRLAEKTLFRELAIPTPPYRAVNGRDELAQAAADVGLPAVLKTGRFGYDGKGQVVLRSQADLDPAWAILGASPLILEGFVPFDREVSALVVRSRTGEVAVYPLAENQHRDGILRTSVARPGDPVEVQAHGYARRLAEALDHVGVLALELFDVGGELRANEYAPRVHNSGHWTIEGAETSQFENHLRAIVGLPLGPTAPVGHAAMVNFIGAMPQAAAVLALAGAHLHDYGKAPRPGRKVGHATVRAASPEARNATLDALRALADEAP